MSDVLVEETKEELIEQLDDRCKELSEAESLVETLKAGAYELREALSTVLRIANEEVGGSLGRDIADIARFAMRDYNQRLSLWDKTHKSTHPLPCLDGSGPQPGEPVPTFDKVI